MKEDEGLSPRKREGWTLQTTGLPVHEDVAVLAISFHSPQKTPSLEKKFLGYRGCFLVSEGLGSAALSKVGSFRVP